MSGRLGTRLRALEAASAGTNGADLAGVVVLPEGMAMADSEVERVMAAHRERTGHPATVLVLPANGRDAAP